IVQSFSLFNELEIYEAESQRLFYNYQMRYAARRRMYDRLY
ncbi:unnamed protein product, partial [Oikopleura dioica]